MLELFEMKHNVAQNQLVMEFYNSITESLKVTGHDSHAVKHFDK